LFVLYNKKVRYLLLSVFLML